MSKQHKDLSYFRLRLQELLNSSFPEEANNLTFIEQRSELASHAYEDAFMAGYSIDHCNEIARETLFEGLHFSKFNAVFQVICNEFNTLMADDELRPFALKMLPVCEPVFSGYTFPDDFENGYEFKLLYTELTGIITLWIEENGLQ